MRLHKTQSLGPRPLSMRGLQVHSGRGLLSGFGMIYSAFCHKVPAGYALLITIHPFETRAEADDYLNELVLLLTEEEESLYYSRTVH